MLDLQIGNGHLSSSVDVFLMIALLSFVPALIISMTVYVKIVMVISLTRQAIGTALAPPNIVVTGISLILTLFIMSPVINQVYTDAYVPYKENKMTLNEGLKQAEKPIKKFMIDNSKEGHIKMFAKIADVEITTKEEVPFLVANAANITTQMTEALTIAAVLMIGFVVIDLIVGTILMLLGMFMLPPQMITLPIKIIVFLGAGGFEMIFEILMKSIKV